MPLLLEPLRQFDASFGSKYDHNGQEQQEQQQQVGKTGRPKLVCSAWKVSVLECVAERYKAVVLELLATVRQMEDALKKRKKVTNKTTATLPAGSGGGGGGVGGASGGGGFSGKMEDADKIGLQLYLDAQDFKQQIFDLSNGGLHSAASAAADAGGGGKEDEEGGKECAPLRALLEMVEPFGKFKV